MIEKMKGREIFTFSQFLTHFSILQHYLRILFFACIQPAIDQVGDSDRYCRPFLAALDY